MFKTIYHPKYKNPKLAYRFGYHFNTPYGFLPWRFKNNVGFKFSKKGLFSRQITKKKFPVDFGYF